MVLSDHGSLALYAAALDKPLLLAGARSPSTVTGSALAALVARTPRIDRAGDLRDQIDAARAGYRPGGHAPVTGSAFESPERCAQRLRPLLYRLLRLPEPAGEPAFPPFAVPDVGPVAVPALVVGARVDGGVVALTRHPDLRRGVPHDQLDHRHLVADVQRATMGQLGGAAILVADLDGPVERWARVAGTLLDQWPKATLVAAARDARTCLVQTRDRSATLRAVRGADVDPLLLASLAYVRLGQSGTLPGRDRLRIGEHLIDVRLTDGAVEAS